MSTSSVQSGNNPPLIVGGMTSHRGQSKQKGLLPEGSNALRVVKVILVPAGLIDEARSTTKIKLSIAKENQDSSYVKTALKVKLVAMQLALALVVTVTVPIVLTAIAVMGVLSIPSLLFQNHFSKNSHMPALNYAPLEENKGSGEEDLVRVPTDEVRERAPVLQGKNPSQGGFLSNLTFSLSRKKDSTQLAARQEELARAKEEKAQSVAREKIEILKGITEAQHAVIRNLEDLSKLMSEIVNADQKTVQQAFVMNLFAQIEGNQSVVNDTTLKFNSSVDEVREKIGQAQQLKQIIEQTFIEDYEETGSDGWSSAGSKLKLEVPLLEKQRKKNIGLIKSLKEKINKMHTAQGMAQGLFTLASESDQPLQHNANIGGRFGRLEDFWDRVSSNHLFGGPSGSQLSDPIVNGEEEDARSAGETPRG